MTNDDPIARFAAENAARIAAFKDDAEWGGQTSAWLQKAFEHQYMYHFRWMDRPIIQFPADIVATQELIWKVKPDLIVETGIAHGGSLILSASILALIEYEEALRAGTVLDPAKPKRRVLGVDIDIRAHNRAAIEAHPMAGRIDMIQGSSIAQETIDAVHAHAKPFERVMVMLDSNHTHQHVLEELEAYAPLTSKGSYCIVFDTVVEDLAPGSFPDRPWDVGDNPKTAVAAYLHTLAGAGRKGVDGEPLSLELDTGTDDKLLLSAAPGGYLRRT